MYRKGVKRCLDLTAAVLLLILLSPLMLLTALIIKLDSPGPVIFKQERLGKDAKVFNILKFRSMKVNTEHTGSGVYSEKGDQRVTRIGRFLRATSIDELPQLVNIIKGEMSFIGPRPPLTYHPWLVENYTPEQLRMFDVRPGLTGWAQIHGRKNVEWHTRIEMNVWYAEHVSFGLDMKILFSTLGKLWKISDNLSTGATVEKTEAPKKETVNR